MSRFHEAEDDEVRQAPVTKKKESDSGRSLFVHSRWLPRQPLQDERDLLVIFRGFRTSCRNLVKCISKELQAPQFSPDVDRKINIFSYYLRNSTSVT